VVHELDQFNLLAWLLAKRPNTTGIRSGGYVTCGSSLDANQLAGDTLNFFERVWQSIKRIFNPNAASEKDHQHWVRILLSDVEINTDSHWYGQYPSYSGLIDPETGELGVGQYIKYGEVEDYYGWNDPVTDDPPPTPYEFPTLTASGTATGTPIPSETPTPSATPTLEHTLTPSRTPTALPLKGTLTVDQVACRWGPSKTFVARHTVRTVPPRDIELLGQNAGWAYVRITPPGENCWIYLGSGALDLDGDPSTLPFVRSDQNLPLWTESDNPNVDGAGTTSNGNNWTVFWNESPLKGNRDFKYYHITAFVCRNGQMVELFFTTAEPTITIQSDDNCNQTATVVIRVRHDRGFSKPNTVHLQ
jgi:hypothetical protein